MSAPRSILVVEDEYLLATDVSRYLRTLGYEILGPVPTVERALALIDRKPPAAAVLDIQLEEERSYLIADRLVELGIPFVFRTGHMEDILPAHLRERPLLSKLTDLSALGDELRQLLRDQGGFHPPS